jgi:hypothetical protein
VRIGTGAGAVPPGRYVAANVTNCMWEPLDSPNPPTTEPPHVVTGQAVVDIPATTAYFYSAGCGTWTGYVAPAQLVTQFGAGQWVIGEVGTGQVAPGSYQTGGGADCKWATLKGFTGDPTDINQQGDGTSSTTVTIQSTDVGFTSSSCPTWTKVG